ncbi:hypothetical protein K227x_60830 [Rubripirellula lacrimiformis]|uniref:Uncharacterized protein n=1 Tax=Rubripirellula lacrimiformis TaxID=1930273 RepID=A0A517NKI9_9BACT|nr:hypothetical protein [Rubripirellula lacrimiformis]QDT07655.1 hypothetical protein K227x_60830 [Rubripirellula lacrimiformis]
MPKSSQDASAGPSPHTTGASSATEPGAPGAAENEPTSRPSAPRESAACETTHPAFAELDQELNRLQRAIRLAIQDQLAKLTGQSMGSLKENRDLADAIHRLLDSHGLRVRCVECGHPAILRVSPRGGTAKGAFVFDHSIDGRRTFHGGRGTVPEIRLVAKPPRKKRASGTTSVA